MEYNGISGWDYVSLGGWLLRHCAAINDNLSNCLLYKFIFR